MEQAAIAVLGALAAWLSQDGRPRWARWACVVGLIGQPLWIMATWQAQQWGMFALSVVYTAAWIRGIWAHWINPARGPSSAECAHVQSLRLPQRTRD